ncbi:MAG: bifunctional phosphoribosylaminoimidazolecarboxamide formyltransferase/IMP cyclohydrolase [Roseiarcus sp.]|jgi:phosphoribosylaminoimidazolecarboxamide formyltransferase/IMP cyclohydrolase
MAIDPLAPVGRALISVSDKSGLTELGLALAARGVEIVSTGGTASALSKAGVDVVDVAEITGFPEMMDGRLKTLHPRVHGALLAVRSDPSHQASMIAHGIAPIDLLVVNLYPFESALQRAAPFEEMVENIDIGGPAMIRAAAKNHADVVVIVEPEDYPRLLDELNAHDGSTRLSFRREMAQKAYARTAAYDAAISNWLARETRQSAPRWRAFGGKLKSALRYGENPHQRAAFYAGPESRPGVATARQVQGKQLSYNNINDADAAYELVAEFDPRASAAVAIIKHANPCGVALGASLLEAYERALACDPVSAFGGVIAANRRLDAAAARKIVEIFTEAIIAPEADDEALAIVAGKKNLRLLIAGALPDPRAPSLSVRSVAGGLLVQDRDDGALDEGALRIVTKRSPSAAETADLRFAWRVCKHVKSNAIVYVKDGATVGIGAGQMSRVDSSRIAARKAEDAAHAAGLAAPLTNGSVVASDAFFPFADGLVAAAEAGASAVIQPGGSIRDAEAIAAADAAGIAMVFTGMRHFRH